MINILLLYTIFIQISNLNAQKIFLNLKVSVEPFIDVLLSDNKIRFHAYYEPGVYDSDKDIKIDLASNCNRWSVQIIASELKSKTSTLDSGRLFVNNSSDSYDHDDGAGRGYEKMNHPIIIEGTGPKRLGEIATLKFRILTTFADPPSSYGGKIKIITTILP